jgi:hypothetical protein
MTDSLHPDAPVIKPDRPSPEQIAIWRTMTPTEKLLLANRLRQAAIDAHEAALRRDDPGITDEQVRDALRKFVLHGRT